jgi:eukaryotic-like serine/threonine-protein kinase
MMYEMLTGEQPFKGEQPMQIAYQHANDSVPTPSTKNPKVPAELDELVLWATARNPEERPADARALLDQLHDTESLLQTALPATPTSAQRTMVLPSAPAMPPPSNAETMVLGGRGPAPVSHTDEVSDTTSALNIASQKRRRRLPLIILLVLLLAAGAGTAGWWFGIGPGAQVAIPSNLESMSIEDATLALEELDLTVAETAPGGFSLDVAEGAVIQTDPAFGTSVQRGSAVTLLLSQGAEPVVVAPIAGVALSDAQAALAEQDIRIADDIDFRYDAEIERDVVIAATKDGDNFSDGGDAFRGDEVALVVSSGPIPDVANATPEVATSALEDAGLQVEADPRLEYSSSVAEGRVIGLVQDYDTPLRPDASVTLVVSRGPELFPIPDVSGQSFNQARETLQGAGFEVTVDTNAPSIFWDTAVVQTMEPEAGTPVEAGTNVSVRGFFD